MTPDAPATLERRLLTRRCVACGYDGALLHGGRVRHCPVCQCDLRERPAKSYAEMEGLLGTPLTLHRVSTAAAPTGCRPWRDSVDQTRRFLHRWLAFMFISIILVMLIGYLSAAAFAG